MNEDTFVFFSVFSPLGMGMGMEIGMEMGMETNKKHTWNISQKIIVVKLSNSN